jgi:fibronectin-binding autotransporter adhesin
MKSRYVFAGIVTIALILVSVALLQVVSANDPGDETISWTGGDGTSDWGTAANWSPVRVPNTSDKVLIDSGSGVTISSGNQHIIWLHSHQPITISSGGTLELDQASLIDTGTAASLSLNGGTLSGAGDVAISGLFTWSGGTMSGTGTTAANGGISLTTTAVKSLNRILNNDGTANYTGSNFSFYFGTFNNLADGIFNFSSDATIGTSAGGIAFNNAGTFNCAVSSGTAAIGLDFNNYGTVNVQSGTLQLESAGTHTGLFNVAAGATLSFPGGVHQLNAGSNVSGAGTVNFGGGAEHTIAGSYDLTGPTNISGYAVAINSNITIPTTVNLISGRLQGSGNFTMTGLFTWSGGTLGGTGATTASGGISLTTDAVKSLNRTLNNSGTANYTGSNFSFYFGTFNNLAGAIFNLPDDVTITTSAGGIAFNNAGTFNCTTSGTAAIGLDFNNYGTVNVQSGTLRFDSTGTHTGLFDVAAGATLSFPGGKHQLNAGSNVTGAGTVNFGGGSEHIIAGSYDLTGPTNISGYAVAINSNITIPTTVNLISGRLQGSGNFTMTGLCSLGRVVRWVVLVPSRPAEV